MNGDVIITANVRSNHLVELASSSASLTLQQMYGEIYQASMVHGHGWKCDGAGLPFLSHFFDPILKMAERDWHLELFRRVNPRPQWIFILLRHTCVDKRPDVDFFDSRLSFIIRRWSECEHFCTVRFHFAYLKILHELSQHHRVHGCSVVSLLLENRSLGLKMKSKTEERVQ